MYQYDTYDQKLLDERVTQFRDQTRRFLDGQLSDEEFRPLRLMNGLYLQRYAPMLRVNIPYGMLSSRQLRMLAHIACTYDKGFGHISTRQNIQYNWPRLEVVPDILADLASVQMHTIQSSGNCIRNITADQYAGASADEIEDPRPWCEILRQWSTFHPEFSYLPRKFKFAVSGASKDRAAVQVHDIGLYLVTRADGEVGFKVLVGGGLGRTPVIGKVIRKFLPKQHLLSYMESILRVYNRFGRRDNRYKARIKILVNATGIAKFTEMVEQEWVYIKDSILLDEKEMHRVRAGFKPPDYDLAAATDTTWEQDYARNAAFAAWLDRNVKHHKIAGYRIVVVSLKAPTIAPGDITDTQMDALADLADRYSFGEVATTHDQNIVMPHVKQGDLFALWQVLQSHDLATPNVGLLTDMICCPGLDFCSLANAGSIPIAKQINDLFDDMDYLYDIGEVQIKMSGCMNACGHHHVGHIGILGVDKKGAEYYQLTLGGSAENTAALGDRLGPAIAKAEVSNAIKRLLDVYVAERITGETFLETYRRIGIGLYKQAIYPDKHAA